MEEEISKPISIVKSFLNKTGKVFNYIEVIILSLGTFLLAALLIANVIARQLFRSIYYAEEISMILVLIVTFTGVSYGVRKARHIRMGAIFDAIGNRWPRVQKIVIYIILIYSAFIMFIMVYYSYNALEVTRMTRQATPSLGISYWLLYIVVIAGFFSAGIQYLRAIYKNVVEKEVWLSPENQSEYEEEDY